MQQNNDASLLSDLQGPSKSVAFLIIMNNTIDTYKISALGCKVNQYDAQQIEELLNRYGLKKAGHNSSADLIVVHTCGVTATAAQKSRQTIRRLKRENQKAHLIITGCAANDSLTKIEEESHMRVPAGKEWLKSLAQCIEQLPLPQTGLAKAILTDETTIKRFGDHTRAFLKIQDGCNIGCTYCIVPSLRKEPRDKPIDAVIKEATTLTQNGYREIVVTGVSVGLYGQTSDSSLAKVLQELVKIPNIGRIRMSSLHPTELTNELIEVWASSSQIMPHLHLSLQSGSNEILSAMRRGYSAEDYWSAVEKAKKALKTPTFTTDVIVGFPGETEKNFEETIALCNAVGFARIHSFTFSPRPGTIAATLPEQINGNIAKERLQRLIKLSKTLTTKVHQSFIGKKVTVLVEKDNKNRHTGYTEHYIPTTLVTKDQSKLSAETIVTEVKSATESNISNK